MFLYYYFLECSSFNWFRFYWLLKGVCLLSHHHLLIFALIFIIKIVVVLLLFKIKTLYSLWSDNSFHVFYWRYSIKAIKHEEKMKSSCYFFNKKSFLFISWFTNASLMQNATTQYQHLHSYYIANIIMKTFTLKSNISDWNRLNWFMHKWCMLWHDIHILNLWIKWSNTCYRLNESEKEKKNGKCVWLYSLTTIKTTSICCFFCSNILEDCVMMIIIMNIFIFS